MPLRLSIPALPAFHCEPGAAPGLKSPCAHIHCQTVTAHGTRGARWGAVVASQLGIQCSRVSTREEGQRAAGAQPHGAPGQLPCFTWGSERLRRFFPREKDCQGSTRRCKCRLTLSVLRQGQLPVCPPVPMATHTVPDKRPQGNTNIFQPLPFIFSLS